VGSSLAVALGWHFIDADSEIVRKQGLSISEMVNKQGWGAFRELERSVIKHLCTFNKYVVATGGGAVLNNDNVNDMKKNGVLVWLRAFPATIRKRILRDHHTEDYRPALSPKGIVEEIEEMLLTRNPYYENAMDFFVDTDDIGIDEVCRAVIKKLKKMKSKFQVSDMEFSP